MHSQTRCPNTSNNQGQLKSSKAQLKASKPKSVR